MVTLEEASQFTQFSTEQVLFHLPYYQQKKTKKFKIHPQHMSELLEKLHLGIRKRIITIAALKGGIGKTFLSTSAAIRSSMLGAKVLLIDLDPEACATNSLLTEEQIESNKKKTIYDVFRNNCSFEEAIWPTKYYNLNILPASLRVAKTERIINGKNPKTLLKKYLDNLPYDLIFFELPPSFSTLSSSAYLASDLIVIPCTPNIHSLESVDLTIEAVNEVASEFECDHIEFKILMNMFNPKRTASQDTLTILKEDHEKRLYPFQIRESAEILNSINAGLSIFESKCSPNVKDGIEEMVQTLCALEVRSETKKKGAQSSQKDFHFSPQRKSDLNNRQLTQ